MARKDPIAVIGAGITGLSAAWEIQSQGHEVVVLEASQRIGGKILTTEHMGAAIDEGGDAFLARVPWGIDLCRELGLTDQMISPAARDAFIWSDGELHPLPSPNVLGIPLDPEGARGGLLSDKAIDALLADLRRVEPDPVADDETIGSLVRRRLGDEVFEKLVNPLIGAINAGDCDQLSVHSSAPQIASAAMAHSSLLQGLIDLRGEPDPDAPVFHSLPGGMGRLVDALTLHVGESVRTETPVGELEPTRGGLRINLINGHQIGASACVLAVPAWAAAPMVRVWPSAASALDQIRFVSVVMVTLTYKASDLAHLPSSASGFLVPHHESPLITACSFASHKWPHLGEDQVHVRVSLGHSGEDAIVKAVESDLLPIVRSDLAATAGIEAEPLAVRVSRWPKSFPQYDPGHVDLVAAIDEELSPSGIFAAGASLAGIGIPACINQGRTAARESIRYVTGLDSPL